MERPEVTRDRSRVPQLVVAGLALAALVVIGFFYLSSGLVAPLWAVVCLVVVWLLMFAVGIAWFRRHPLRVLALPVLAVVIWVVVLTLGERLLGWTA